MVDNIDRKWNEDKTAAEETVCYDARTSIALRNEWFMPPSAIPRQHLRHIARDDSSFDPLTRPPAADQRRGATEYMVGDIPP